MFDIGWTEMLVVAIVAILFVGPKELPAMLRAFGKSVKKIRALAGDFQQQFDTALKDAELDGVKDVIKDVRNLDPTKAIKDKLNPLKGAVDDVKKSVEDAADFDVNTLFNDDKAPKVEPAVEVDVDAALERQRKIDVETADATVVKKPASKKSAAKKPAAKKAATNKTSASKKPAVKKPAVKKAPPKRKSTKKADA